MPRRLSRSRGPKQPSSALRTRLELADALIERSEFADAGRLLKELDQRFRNEPDVVGRMLNLAQAAGDRPAYIAAAERLVRLLPGEPDLALALAVAYLNVERLALAYRAFVRFAKRWPTHEHAAEARRQADSLYRLLAVLWADLGLAGEPETELLVQHEEIQELLSAGDWQQAVRLAEQALQRHPYFVAIRNNLSLAYQNSGRLDKAVAEARKVVERDPHNLHAMGNLTRFLVLAGELDQARQWAVQLKSVPSSSVDIAVKQAESLSFLGDDEGVLAAFDRVQKLPDRDLNPSASALLHHLAAVASLRLGRSQAAHRRWHKALELQPGLELAAANLADLNRPEDERHAPWPYSLEYWLTRPLLNELFAEFRAHTDEALTRNARRFLQRHPALAAILPALLDRGDPSGREFALQLASLAETPEMLAVLRDFALGKRGPVQSRLQAARIAQHAGLISNGMVRFWQGGAWQETLMLGFEIHGEALPPNRPPEIVELQHAAALALNDGDGTTSERLLLQALAKMPDEPSLLNNLGATYGKLGRSDEAEAIARRLFAEHPDYTFARTNIVPYLVMEGRFDEAQALIDPLLRRTRLHFSEFGALMGAQISIYIEQGNFKTAQSWLDMWAEIDPKHSHLLFYRTRLRMAKSRRRFRR